MSSSSDINNPQNNESSPRRKPTQTPLRASHAKHAAPQSSQPRQSRIPKPSNRRTGSGAALGRHSAAALAQKAELSSNPKRGRHLAAHTNPRASHAEKNFDGFDTMVETDNFDGFDTMAETDNFDGFDTMGDYDGGLDGGFADEFDGGSADEFDNYYANEPIEDKRKTKKSLKGALAVKTAAAKTAAAKTAGSADRVKNLNPFKKNKNPEKEESGTGFWSRHRKLKKVLKWIVGIIVAFVLILWVTCLRDLPECKTAADFNVNLATEVYASDHETLLARLQLEQRIPLDSLDDIVSYASEGTVATEDERFYYHPGFDVIGIGRAVLNNLSGGTLEGASTITQQLVRNTILRDEANDITIRRKIREAYLAIKMEIFFTKDEILLMYMNTINYGSGAYGIEAASQRYFSKSASELTLNEAATLIGIPQSPTYNNPIDFMDHAIDRRNIVLDRMVSFGTITQEEADAVKQEEIELETSELSNDGFILYPYFSSYVRDVLLNDYDLDTETIFQGGLTVYTTLDIDVQEAADAAVEKRLSRVSSDVEVALACVEPDTGYVRALVGGRDFYEDQWNLATQAQRQAGSSFKTYTLIAALEAGIDPETQVDCTEWVRLPNSDHIVYNYGHHNYGVVSIARAFAVSSNTGFTRLIAAVTPQKVAEVAYRMGIDSYLREEASLTLGASEVTPLEMAEAYSCIATGGIHHDAVVIEQAIDRKGNVVIDNTEPEEERVLDEKIACAAIDVMRGVVESGTGTAAKLSCGQDAVGKTGTSEYDKDSWFVGLTPQYAVALWTGDRDNRYTVSSIAGVFKDFLDPVLEGTELREFPTADKPKYTKTFKNSDLDLGTTSASSVKNTEGMTLEEAKSALGGFSIVVEEEFSDDIEAGIVIKQEMSGEQIKLTVSKGVDPEKEDPGGEGDNPGGESPPAPSP